MAVDGGLIGRIYQIGDAIELHMVLYDEGYIVLGTIVSEAVPENGHRRYNMVDIYGSEMVEQSRYIYPRTRKLDNLRQ